MQRKTSGCLSPDMPSPMILYPIASQSGNPVPPLTSKVFPILSQDRPLRGLSIVVLRSQPRWSFKNRCFAINSWGAIKFHPFRSLSCQHSYRSTTIVPRGLCHRKGVIRQPKGFWIAVQWALLYSTRSNPMAKIGCRSRWMWRMVEVWN